ncbi:hypothetical protein [Chromohalobacter sp. 296-RDG]|uniref:hypothetical protein n=1 Tax=Chromohalobacter sp. 296-RDG TaxID=2994062 RepID=UPI002468AE72|nr:hypothetical protein [Chromohalobacter sp. 296-RDG]
MFQGIEDVVKGIGGEGVWVAVLTFFIAYIIKKEPFRIFAYFYDKADKDFNKMLLVFQSEGIGREVRENTEEYLERYTFKKACYIDANKEMRSALIYLHAELNGAVGWRLLKSSLPYLNLNESGKLEVSIQLKDKIGRWFTTIFSVLLCLYALVVAIYSFVYVNEHSWRLFGLLVGAMLLFSSSLIVESANWPYRSAVKINQLIEEKRE